MKLIQHILMKLKSLIGIKKFICNLPNDKKIEEDKKVEFEGLKIKISGCKSTYELKDSILNIYLFIKKYNLTKESEEYKILKTYVNIQKLRVKYKNLKNEKYN